MSLIHTIAGLFDAFFERQREKHTFQIKRLTQLLAEDAFWDADDDGYEHLQQACALIARYTYDDQEQKIHTLLARKFHKNFITTETPTWAMSRIYCRSNRELFMAATLHALERKKSSLYRFAHTLRQESGFPHSDVLLYQFLSIIYGRAGDRSSEKSLGYQSVEQGTHIFPEDFPYPYSLTETKEESARVTEAFIIYLGGTEQAEKFGNDFSAKPIRRLLHERLTNFQNDFPARYETMHETYANVIPLRRT